VARPSTFPEADEATGGDLEDVLRIARTEGVSFPTVARMLLTEYGYVVSPETLRRWSIERGIDHLTV